MNLPLSLKALVTVVLAILLAGAIGYSILSAPGNASISPLPSTFTVNGKTFQITYVATDQSEWEAGLMNRKITASTTMLFIFPEPGIYPFWMYDTNSSLDILWLNVAGSTGKMVYIVAGAPSCYLPIGCPNYTPSAAANYVIEAKAGFAGENGVSVGTVIQFG